MEFFLKRNTDDGVVYYAEEGETLFMENAKTFPWMKNAEKAREKIKKKTEIHYYIGKR